MRLSESEFESYNYSEDPISLPLSDDGAELLIAELKDKGVITEVLADRIDVNQDNWNLPKDEFDQIIHHLWTVVDGDSNNLIAAPGLHFVNRISLLVSEKPWTEEIDEAIYAEFDDEDFDEDYDDEEPKPSRFTP